jgi:hypothetical protein
VSQKAVTPVNPPGRASTGVQWILSEFEESDSCAFHGLEPGFAGITKKRFRPFYEIIDMASEL